MDLGYWILGVGKFAADERSLQQLSFPLVLVRDLIRNQ
jgi:hypothetical protein